MRSPIASGRSPFGSGVGSASRSSPPSSSASRAETARTSTTGRRPRGTAACRRSGGAPPAASSAASSPRQERARARARGRRPLLRRRAARRVARRAESRRTEAWSRVAAASSARFAASAAASAASLVLAQLAIGLAAHRRPAHGGLQLARGLEHRRGERLRAASRKAPPTIAASSSSSSRVWRFSQELGDRGQAVLPPPRCLHVTDRLHEPRRVRAHARVEHARRVVVDRERRAHELAVDTRAVPQRDARACAVPPSAPPSSSSAHPRARAAGRVAASVTTPTSAPVTRALAAPPTSWSSPTYSPAMTTRPRVAHRVTAQRAPAPSTSGPAARFPPSARRRPVATVFRADAALPSLHGATLTFGAPAGGVGRLGGGPLRLGDLARRRWPAGAHRAVRRARATVGRAAARRRPRARARARAGAALERVSTWSGPSSSACAPCAASEQLGRLVLPSELGEQAPEMARRAPVPGRGERHSRYWAEVLHVV